MSTSTVASASEGQLVFAATANETGLVNKGWAVHLDEPEGKIDLSSVSYKTDFHWESSWMVAESIIARLMGERGVIGSLGLAKLIFNAQHQGRDLLPESLRGTHFVMMSKTLLFDPRGRVHVPCLGWYQGKWVWDNVPLDIKFCADKVAVPWMPT